MTPKQIVAECLKGSTVSLRIRRLRGYVHGFTSITFTPLDGEHGIPHIAHRLKCFRFDEKPYDNPTWTVVENGGIAQ